MQGVEAQVVVHEGHGLLLQVRLQVAGAEVLDQFGAHDAAQFDVVQMRVLLDDDVLLLYLDLEGFNMAVFDKCVARGFKFGVSVVIVVFCI